MDLNEKTQHQRKHKDDFTIRKDGIPICKAGKKMNHDVIDITKTASNSAALWQAENTVVPVKILVPIQNTEGRSTLP